MNILQTIAAKKRTEVANAKILVPVSVLEQSPLYDRATVSLVGELKKPGGSGIIAEFKRQSPSRGIINSHSMPEEVTTGYIQAGAIALSVLTDNKFFGGSNNDLIRVRKVNSCPILRKDFVVDSYQIIEAKSLGADVILLIAAILTPEETLTLATLARSLGLETILEVHGVDELNHLNDQISILGVNNRNLGDFTVNLENSISMADLIPEGITAIAESGIHDPADIKYLRQAGYDGFLIGERFMSTKNPAIACLSFITGLEQIES